MAKQLNLFLPDRFDALEREAKSQLKDIVVEVKEATDYVKDLYADISSAGRGGFVIFRGDSGSGKSTFLHTLVARPR